MQCRNKRCKSNLSITMKGKNYTSWICVVCNEEYYVFGKDKKLYTLSESLEMLAKKKIGAGK